LKREAILLGVHKWINGFLLVPPMTILNSSIIWL